MFHSVTINGKNTWDDYHMIPANGIYLPPPPEQKRTTIDLKTGNGLLDVSTVLTGYPLFQNRSGELQYFILDPWDLDDYVIDNSKMAVDKLESRIKKYFNDSATTEFFNIVRSKWDSANKDYLIIAAIGNGETQTAVSVVRNLVKGGNKNPPVFSVGWPARQVFACDGTNSNSTLHIEAYYTMWNASSRRYSNSSLEFAFGPQVVSGYNTYNPFTEDYNYQTWNRIILPLENNLNLSGMTMYCNYDIVQSTSSSTVKYPKNLIFSSGEYRPHTMPDPYEVYSQLLADIHGKTGTMIFEDDPNWYYQGNFTVRSMETNAIRRAVSIGYEVAPYKIKTSSITQTTTSVNSSSWITFNYSAADIGSMPVHPKVRVTSLPSGGSLSVKFTSPSSTGTAITKTITTTGDHTWADVIVYNNTLTISYLGSADSGYNVTHIITPGRL